MARLGGGNVISILDTSEVSMKHELICDLPWGPFLARGPQAVMEATTALLADSSPTMKWRP